MTTYMVIGGQWGDEGKGKIVDYLARYFHPDIGIRFNGGANAGHSIENEYGKNVLHLVPSTIFNPKCVSVIGNGVVIDPLALMAEMENLASQGVSLLNLRISNRAHLVMPWHLLRDKSEEKGRGANKIGTTGRGIGPTYADKSAREGIRVGDLIDQLGFVDREVVLNQLVRNGHDLIDESKFWLGMETAAYAIYSYICPTEKMLVEARSSGKTLLFEGAQGTLLDIDFGIYPRVTSSGTTRLGAYQGSGLPPDGNEIVFGVLKGYVTRVGEGIFPTELDDENGNRMRQLGNEYGATTGRPRRCGWFDAVLARYAQQINGFTYLVLTKSDVMDTFGTIKICVGYLLDGERIDYIPVRETDLARCTPVYEEMEGWQKPTSDLRKFGDLPLPMQRYCRRLEELVGVPIGLISVGPKQEETIGMLG